MLWLHSGYQTAHHEVYSLGVMQCGETITYAHDTLLRIIMSVCLCVLTAHPALRTTAGRLAATWKVYLAMVEL